MSKMKGFAGGLSATAAGLLVIMLFIAVKAGGVTQQKFELFAPLADYVAAFTAAKPVILETLVFDNLFIIAYVGALALGLSALATVETRMPAALAISAIIVAGILDYAENLHFIIMYARLDSGLSLTADELGWRMWASMMKWHLAYAGLVFASFVIPVRGIVSWSLVWSLRTALPIVGVLIYAGPEAWRQLLGLVRYALMLVGFVMFTVIFVADRPASGSGEAAS